MTELHKRLNQIVECSSQLVFVTADTVSCQQKALSEFLSYQNDNTDVSFFKADKNESSDHYRRSIYSQITGNNLDPNSKKLTHILDLNQLSNSREGVYLVCISQAECLQNEFLNELWSWTLYQRKYPNIRLSILLFCETNWAQKALESIPSNTESCPILISEDTQDTVGFDVNALESLMNDKHSWLSTINKPLVTKKWFLASVASIFLVTFTSLMSLQFSNDQQSEPNAIILMKSENKDQAISKAQENYSVSKDNVEESQYIDDEIQNQNVVFATDFSITVPSKEVTSVNLDLKENSSHAERSIDSINLEQALKSSVSEHDNFNDVSEKTNSLIVSTSNLEKGNNITKSSNINEKADEVIDFKVDDITSVEQLSLALSNVEVKNPSSVDYISNVNKTNVDYRFDETTLLSLPNNAVVLQLSGIQNAVVLENYLKNNNLETSTWVYETQRYGGPWYVVTYKQVFDSIESALSNISSLPEVIKESQPFAKSINQIQQEINNRN